MVGDIVQDTAKFVEGKLRGEGSGHDWWHIYRVWQNARHIAAGEPGADMFVVELGALLHDIADWKFTGGDLEVGPRIAREWLEKCGVKPGVISHVEDIIRTVSFKGAGVKVERKSIEAKIVSDADKLDAIGAIGIARTFAYGGHAGREMYDPTRKPTQHQSFDAYKSSTSPSINHFYEKMLLLKDLLETEAARKIAGHRHAYMEQFLDEFYAEWSGER